MCFMRTTYLMALCAIALQELLNIYHSYSISVGVNFNPLKSFCVGFAPNILSCHYRKLIFTFTSSHKDDNDILSQMRILYARSKLNC